MSEKVDRRAMVLGVEPFEVLEARANFRNRLDCLSRKLHWLAKRREDIVSVPPAKQRVQHRRMSRETRRLTGYSLKHINRNRHADVMSRIYTRKLLDALIEHARNERDGYRQLADEAGDIADGLINLKLNATDDRLFDQRRFPHGDANAERDEEKKNSLMRYHQLRRNRVTISTT